MSKRVLGLCVTVSLMAAVAIAITACGGGTPSTSGSERSSRATAAPSAGELNDFGRDIDQLALGVSDAPTNFADDLFAFGKRGVPSRGKVNDLAAKLSAALKGKRLAGADRDTLRDALVGAVANGPLPADGLAKVRTDVEGSLTRSGVPADSARDVAAAAEALSVK